MVVSLTISAVLAVLAGFLIIVWKKSVNWIIGGWLVLYGLLQLFSGFID